jgi:glycine/D-amino acid oxidase-like deaminating enzyme
VNTDYLIVGQGIAGSVMALTLERMGKSVAVMGAPELSSSSRIAAGVYNPFNFRRTAPVWKAAEAVVQAHAFYSAAGQLTGKQFNASLPILRILSSEQEHADWQTYSEKTDNQFLSRTPPASAESEHVKAPFGTGNVQRGGMLDTETFLQAVRDHFNKRGYYLEERCDHTLFVPNENSIVYDARIETQHVIFCEGHLATHNPFFDVRSVKPTKGELLHVRIPGFSKRCIVNGPVYVAPLGEEEYVCGATFNPGKDDEEITAAGRDELIAKLKTITDLPFEIIAHYAGVRPAGRDRKPVIGRSRSQRNFSIFNGFGSKAVLHSPFLAQMLADHLENGSEILPEVNVARFKVY